MSPEMTEITRRLINQIRFKTGAESCSFQIIWFWAYESITVMMLFVG